MKIEIPVEASHSPVRSVTIGALPEQGGTRTRTVTIGGSTAFPFNLFEGAMPHQPAMALEVFDVPPKKFPAPLLEYYGDVLAHPVEMAKRCVEQFGAEMLSVRLEGTHPDKGNLSPEAAAELVRSILEAVGVPLIITGHTAFAKNNEVMRKVAEAASSENCLLNWVEKDNYKTIAACCLAHGHCLVAQSPIDVNIAKQLNIQLLEMSFPAEKIVMDPLSSGLGYGLEYSYSMMERIRSSGLAGDEMLRMPMLITPGRESSLCKEAWAAEEHFPAWGTLEHRCAYWEIATAMALVLAGAELLILYHPMALKTVKDKIEELCKE